MTCKQPGCNRKNRLFTNCVQCDSESDDKCHELPDPKVFTKQCKGIYPYSKRGCFTLKHSMRTKYVDWYHWKLKCFFFVRNSKDNTLTRGCIKDLAAEENDICQKEKDKCHLCLDKDGCNTMTPGTSTNLCSNRLLIMLAVLFASFITLQLNS